MKMASTIEAATVTFGKQLGPGVAVQVTGIPAEIVHRRGKDDLTLFSRPTSSKLLRLIRVARDRMARGETNIVLDFTSDE